MINGMGADVLFVDVLEQLTTACTAAVC